MQKTLPALFFLLLQFFLLKGWCQNADVKSILTPEEITWIKENAGKLKFAPTPAWPPADFIEDDSIHKGIVSDYIALFENQLNVKFQRVYFETWHDLISGLQNGEADFTGAVQPTMERAEYLNFSEPYINVPLVLLSRTNFHRDIDDQNVDDFTISGVRGNSSVDYLKTNYPQAIIIEEDENLHALMNTSLGKSDVTVVDLMTASYLVQKFGINNLKFEHKLKYTWNLSFGVRKDYPQLSTILNKLLQSVSEAQRMEIFNKWVNLDVIEQESFFQKYSGRIIAGGVILVFLLMLAGFYSYLLRKKVSVKTKELSKQIEEKNELLKKIKKSQEDYIFLFNQAGLPKWIYEIESYKILEVNEIAIRQYGYSREEFLSMTIKDIRPKEDISQLLDISRRKIKIGKQVYHGVFRHLKKTGEIIYVEISTSDIIYKGKSCRIVAANNVTEKIKAFESLQVSIERYEYVTRATSEAIWDWDLVNSKIYLGEGYTRLFGWDKEMAEKDQDFWKSCLHPQDQDKTIKSIIGAIEDGADTWSETYRYRRKDGSYADVFDKAIILRNEKGVAVRVVGAMQDITERNRYIRAVEEQNERLKEIAWIQSHVLRAPVARIEGLVRLMEAENKIDPESNEYFKYIVQSVRELDKISRDIFIKTRENDLFGDEFKF